MHPGSYLAVRYATCQPGNYLRETLVSHVTAVLQSEGPGSYFQQSESQFGGGGGAADLIGSTG